MLPSRGLRALRSCVCALLSLPVLLAGNASAYGDDWPQWMGPRRDNISRETQWNAEFPPTGPKIAWKAAIGTGFSSAAVANGKVYVTGNASGSSETVHCFDAESGKVIWTHSYPGELIDKLHEGGPSSTPTVHEGKVYVVGKQGQMHCLTADDGKVVWTADLLKLSGLRALPEWGFSAAPVIDGELIVLQAGPIVALRKSDGSLAWKSENQKAAYGSVMPFDLDGRRYYTALNTGGAVVVSDSGKELALFRWLTSYDTNATTPIVQGDRIFISTGYDKGCVLLQFKPNELNAVYRHKKMRNHMNNSVLYDGHLYGFDGNSHQGELADLVCMDFASGEEKWRHNGLGCGSLIVAGDKLVVLGEKGELVIAPATPKRFDPISAGKVISGRCWSPPTLADGRIYVRNAAGDFVCVDVRK